MRTSDNRLKVLAIAQRAAIKLMEDSGYSDVRDTLIEIADQLDAAAEGTAGEGPSDDVIEWAMMYGTDFRRPTKSRVAYGVEWKDSHGRTRWTYGASYDEAIEKARVAGEVRPSIGARVTVRGNTGLPDVSGRSGVVVSYHPDHIALRVRLDGDEKSLLLDPSNLVREAAGAANT